MRSSRVLIMFFAGFPALLLMTGPAAAGPPATERVSVSSAGGQADLPVDAVAVNADGRYAAFVSEAGTLVPGDTNLTYDVFVRDRRRGVTERVSVSSTGEQGNSGYFGNEHPVLSADGRFVAFASYASNLVPGDTNDTADIFVRDRLLGRTTRVSVSTTGEQGNNASDQPVISADGRYVAFATLASNLVAPAGLYNQFPDVLVHDRQLGTTVLVNPAPTGTEENAAAGSPSISADGRYVSFSSSGPGIDDSDVSGVVVRDRATGTLTRASVTSAGAPAVDTAGGVLSGNGRYVAFYSFDPSVVAGDSNASADVFVRDLRAGTTRRVSLSTSGAQGDGDSYGPAISHNGRYVAFNSYASTLVARDGNDNADVFVTDRWTGTTRRVSVSRTGGDADGVSEWAAISGDGRHVAFLSTATNLVAGDTNHYGDAFVRSGR